MTRASTCAFLILHSNDHSLIHPSIRHLSIKHFFKEPMAHAESILCAGYDSGLRSAGVFRECPPTLVQTGHWAEAAGKVYLHCLHF